MLIEGGRMGLSLFKIITLCTTYIIVVFLILKYFI